MHAGERRARKNGGSPNGKGFYPVSTPVYLSTTFAHEEIEQTDKVLGGEEFGYSYAR